MMVLLSEMVEYFLILAFEKPDHLSNTEGHQHYISNQLFSQSKGTFDAVIHS